MAGKKFPGNLPAIENVSLKMCHLKCVTPLDHFVDPEAIAQNPRIQHQTWVMASMHFQQRFRKRIEHQLLVRKHNPLKVPVRNIGNPNNFHLVGAILVTAQNLLRLQLWRCVQNLSHVESKWVLLKVN